MEFIKDAFYLIEIENITARVIFKEYLFRHSESLLFEYAHNSSIKSFVHPDYPNGFILPYGIAKMVVRPELVKQESVDSNSYEHRLSLYINDNFDENDIDRARLLFNKLDREYVESNYLNK